MTLYEMQQKIVEAIKKYGEKPLHDWNNTTLLNWEWNLLHELKAIDNKKILCDYPSFCIMNREKGENIFEDMGGNLDIINQAVRDFNSRQPLKSKQIAIVWWWPRTYYLFQKAKKEMYKAKEITEKHFQDNPTIQNHEQIDRLLAPIEQKEKRLRALKSMGRGLLNYINSNKYRKTNKSKLLLQKINNKIKKIDYLIEISKPANASE